MRTRRIQGPSRPGDARQQRDARRRDAEQCLIFGIHAAEAVLRKHGLWDAIRPRLVLGDTIAQAAQFATTGNAVGGLIAYSLVLAPGFAARGTYAVLPATDHEPLRQRMVLLKQAHPAIVHFYDYVQSDAARAILRKHGYGVPQ